MHRLATNLSPHSPRGVSSGISSEAVPWLGDIAQMPFPSRTLLQGLSSDQGSMLKIDTKGGW